MASVLQHPLETFECSCDSSWGGKYCDVYSVIVEIPVSNATNATNGTQAPTTSAPTTSAPTQSPTLSPTYASNATNTTSEEVNTFSDLINTASIFIEKLSTGKLDVGYEVKEVAIELPPAPDACGVRGGDGTSCLDCAGTPNGDAEELACGCNDATSCVDDCGVPNGENECLLQHLSPDAYIQKC